MKEFTSEDMVFMSRFGCRCSSLALTAPPHQKPRSVSKTCNSMHSGRARLHSLRLHPRCLNFGKPYAVLIKFSITFRKRFRRESPNLLMASLQYENFRILHSDSKSRQHDQNQHCPRTHLPPPSAARRIRCIITIQCRAKHDGSSPSTIVKDWLS